MIKASRIVPLADFIEKIVPRTDYSHDTMIADFADFVHRGIDFVYIFRDYEVVVKLDEIKAYMEKYWKDVKVEKDNVPDPLDAILPRVAAVPMETPEEREVAAKHPKPADLPKFKPIKRPPAAPAPDEDDVL